MKEIYVSIDIEADGPIPGQNSMLSLGAVAFKPDGTEIDSFEANLNLLSGATQDPDTMRWWGEPRQKNAWEYCRTDPQRPNDVMQRFVAWVESLGKTPVCVAYPAGYDFMWVYWYMQRFVGRSPFSFSCVDIKTVAMCLLKKKGYRQSSKRNWPGRWFRGTKKHSHKAVEDAREQGIQFCHMLRELRGQ
jgi:hypothetical protein